MASSGRRPRSCALFALCALSCSATAAASEGSRARAAAWRSRCDNGRPARCPYSGVRCVGHQCCPGTAETGFKNFVCPAAEPLWDARGKCQLPYKLEDCRAGTTSSTVVTSTEAATTTLPDVNTTATTTLTTTTAFEVNVTTATFTTTATALATATATFTTTATATTTTTTTTTTATATTAAATTTFTTAAATTTSATATTTTATVTRTLKATPPTSTTTPAPSTTAEPPGTETSTRAATTTAAANTTTFSASAITTTTPSPVTTTSTIDWCEDAGRNYGRVWSAEGRDFFRDFEFLTSDYNHGAAWYLPYDSAVQAGVVEAHDTHAILRTGRRVGRPDWPKRESAKIQTSQGWKYFLMMMRYSHVPYGCGVWPALWTHATGVAWPNGGELDVLEYANDSPQQTSFHTGERNRCKLDPQAVNMCSAMPDMNGMGYDCNTSYPDKLGCAPNRLPLWPGELWSRAGGVIAVEWTDAFVKVFQIPEDEVPLDALSEDPRPEHWDQWLVSFYPFAASEARVPGSCPQPGDVMDPQHLVLNINMCGDWAGKIWNISGSCVNYQGPEYPSQCRAVDPLKDYDPEHDCCSQFIFDANGTYGTDSYLQERAYFNISWIRVFQEKAPQAASAAEDEAPIHV